MIGIVVFLHVMICLLLVTIILMQRGKGGGLTEQFSSAESMFGAKTNVVLIKATTIFGCVFLITCLSLAYHSSRAGKSLIKEEDFKNLKKLELPVKEAKQKAVPAAQSNMQTNPAVPMNPAGENANPPTPDAASRPGVQEPAKP